MPCNASEAAHLAKLLITGYPNSALTEPEYYIAQVVAVFTQYDIELVRKAVAPSGIPYDLKPYMPTIGEIEGWLRVRADKMASAKEHQLRIEKQMEETDAWMQLQPSDVLKAKAKAWLDRADPIAQQLSGKKPVKVYSEEEKRAFLDDASKAGREISGMKLLPETIRALKEKGELMAMEPIE